MEQNIHCSIIIPVYYNEGTLAKTFDYLKEEVIKKNSNRIFEIIFIDDGSGDGSLEELMRVKKENGDLVKIIKFTRNFGQVAAVMAGYQHATGECIVNISADLQDPPELINEMLNHHFNNDYEIIICHREDRDESFFRKTTSGIFYKLIRKLSFPNMPDGGFDFALISNRVKENILSKREANPFWQGQILWTGYNVKYIPYERKKREIGKSKWSFSKKIKYLIDGVMSYSYFPLRLMSVTGIIVSIAGFIYAINILVARIFGAVPVKGWAPLMIMLLILSGIQMLMLGVIGEYLWRTLDQARNRQPFIIDKIYE